MKTHLHVFLVAAALLLPLVHRAAEVRGNAKQVTARLIAHNIVIASGRLNLRREPPSGAFQMRGDTIRVIEPGSLLIKLSSRQTLFDNQEWVKVRTVSLAGESFVEGWVYNGQLPNGQPYLTLPDEQRVAAQLQQPDSPVTKWARTNP